MSLSTPIGVTMKFSGPFLKLCKWFFARMSSNQKHSSPNGNSCSSYKPKKGKDGESSDWKWKKGLLLLWLAVVSSVFIGFLISVSVGKLSRKVETILENEDDNTRESFENFNGSLEKIASLTCCQESGYGMLQSSTIACTLKMLGSEDPQCELAAQNVDLSANCSSIEVANNKYLGLSSPEEMPASFIPTTTSLSISSAHSCCEERNESQNREIRHHASEDRDSIHINFAKVCLWIFVGMAMSYTLCWIYDNLFRQKYEMIRQQPLLQQSQLQQQAPCSSRNTGNWRKKLLVALILGGVIVSVLLFWYLNEDIKFWRIETLGSMCDERARMLQDQFNVSMNHVHAMAILVSTFHHGKRPSAIDQKTFEDYTEITAFERPLTSGVAYALRVHHSEREKIEKQYGWTIKKMVIEDQTLAQDCNPEDFSTSPVQDEYAPVIFSQKTVSHIVSIDMMSGKEDRENILRARASGKGVLTSPFKLLKSNHLGVVLTFAVYNSSLPPDATPAERINATVGYLGASYDVPSLVEKLLHQLASKQTIIVNVYDTTSQEAPIKMYGADEGDTGLLRISHLDFGDPTRKHEMHCRFKQKPPPPWPAISASVGVLVITLLLGHIFHAAINEIAKAERGYREMMELKHRAEAADVAKSQFLATVSHEIRTPMNGVLGMLQMLMDTNLDPCQLDFARTAYDSGKDLISLINKVLDQAKIESGRLELEAVPFDPRAVLDKVLSIFSGKSHEKGIELAVYVSDKVPEVVSGDQERFGQIVTNLVGNSIKFTHEMGHILVSVHLADEVRSPHDVKDEVLRQSRSVVQDDSSNASFNTLSGCQVVDRWRSWENFQNLESTGEKIKLLVTVEDTGTGIPPEAQTRIFTPFMQADSSTSRKYGGTGIGLSISKRLVDLMGGEIGFVSELGTGSTFTFTATFEKAEANSLNKKWQPCDPSISKFKGLRALVIDEKSVRAQVTRYHLQRLRISVDITSSMESSCSYLLSNSKSGAPEFEQFAMVLINQEDWDKETWFPLHNLIKIMRHNISKGKSGIPLKIFLLATGCNKVKADRLVDELIAKPLRLSALVSSFQEATGKKVDTQRVRASSTLRTLLKGRVILVVDDNAVNRRVAEGALKKYGAVVRCVEGGKAAVELLKPPHNFDACFMDLQMPEMDGLEATRQIRNLERMYSSKRLSCGEWHTPILAMTADVVQATYEACVKCGMDDFVSKPFGEGQLYSAVACFFD